MTEPSTSQPVAIAVVIPCFKVRRHILSVIAAIGPEVNRIYVVDDKCPENSGEFVQKHAKDPRVLVLFHDKNQGVGGAMMTGYQQAIEDGTTVIVKIDGDGQMDPSLIPQFVSPILNGNADYTKGNRFFYPESVTQMPRVRLLGNAVLSFASKLSSGYWHILDPTNGFTAIHSRVARELPFGKLSKRYYFESDILFRLNILTAVVLDIPMDAQYGTEESNLKIHQVAAQFFFNTLRNATKRVFYNYYLRGFNLASIQLPLGILLFFFGLIFGAWKWIDTFHSGAAASSGTVMLAALPLIIGTQLLLSFLAHDVQSVPHTPLQLRLRDYSVMLKKPLNSSVWASIDSTRKAG